MPETRSELTLLLDTATPTLQLGLALDDTLIYEYVEGTSNHRQHSAVLLPQIQTALSQSCHTMTDITRIAVNIGPGSFTGLRTGVTTARTMGQFMPVTVYAFNAFEILAVKTSGPLYLDALRGRAYSAELTFEDPTIMYAQKPKLIEWSGPYHCPGMSISPMLTLVKAGLGVTPWQDLLPLYLQDPNITQRKPQPGRMK